MNLKGFISNAIEDQSLKLKVQELNEENSRLKCALTTYKDDKETMQDTINELQMKTASLSAKLKEHLKRKVTPHKRGSQVHSVANNTRDGQTCMSSKKLQQNTRRA